VGRVPEGIARAKDVLTREPKSVQAHIVLGTLYLRSGDLRSAVDTFGTATRLDPNSPDSYFALGNAYQQKRDAANAVSAYKRTIALSPKDPRAYDNVAYLYAAEGKNLDEALALARKAQHLRPDSSEILDSWASGITSGASTRRRNPSSSGQTSWPAATPRS
jgi:Flp pilus assembly protein TadD